MTNNLKKIILVLIILSGQPVSGQLTQRPMSYISNNQTHTNTNQRILITSDTLSLPFWDDFSQSYYSVNAELWDLEFSANVFVNGSMGITPPSINVATFDGWDGTGNPHSTEDGVSGLRTDSLISKPINLSGLTVDDSVVFSFYWQQQGFGENPEEGDYLSIEFLSEDNEWIPQDELLIEAAIENRLLPFQKNNIRIRTEQYLHAGFQFKFVSLSNPKGPFDAWHLDYVKLDKQVVFENESIFDIALSTFPTSIFKTYTMIPFDQFFAYPDTIMTEFTFFASTFLFEQKTDTEKDSYLPSFEYQLTETANQEEIASDILDGDIMALVSDYDQELYKFSAIDHSVFDAFRDYDSLYLQSEIRLTYTEAQLNTGIVNFENDTARFEFNIHNTLAYDDGSAEYVAGINQSSGQLAVQFFTPIQDTLTHVDIYFPVIEPLPDVSSIQLRVLEDLSDDESSILTIDEFSVSYPDSINEFFQYTLSSPVIVNGDFYISMKQFTNDYIAIGLDKGTESANKIFYKTGTEWVQNDMENVSGSLMFRAVFATAVVDTVLSTKNTSLSLLEIYPNPANKQLTINGQFDNYSLFNLSGSHVLDGYKPTLNTRELPEGIYLMKVISNGQVLNKRLIIRH